nr:transposase [Parageobacillus thermantarcticus]
MRSFQLACGLRVSLNRADRQHGPSKQPLRSTGAVGSVHTRYHWFKRYKFHLCTTTEGIILSHMLLTTANRNDAAVAPELLTSLRQWDIELVLGDAAYSSEKVRQTAEQSGILLISPINLHNNEERKDAYGRVLPVF